MTSESRIRRHMISLPLSERRSTLRLRWLRPLRRKKTLTPFRYASAPDQWRSQVPFVGSILTPFSIVYPVLSVGGRQTVANTSPVPYPRSPSREPRKTWLAFLEEGGDPL